jgi:hypothetical protein
MYFADPYLFTDYDTHGQDELRWLNILCLVSYGTSWLSSGRDERELEGNTEAMKR